MAYYHYNTDVTTNEEEYILFLWFCVFREAGLPGRRASLHVAHGVPGSGAGRARFLGSDPRRTATLPLALAGRHHRLVPVRGAHGGMGLRRADRVAGRCPTCGLRGRLHPARNVAVQAAPGAGTQPR